MKYNFKARTKVSDFNLKISLVTLLQLFASIVGLREFYGHTKLLTNYIRMSSCVVCQGSANVTETRPFCGRGKALFHSFALFIFRHLKESVLFFPCCKSTFSARAYVMTALASAFSESSGEAKIKSVHCYQNGYRACNSLSCVMLHVSRFHPLRRTRMEDGRLARHAACNWKLVISRQMLVINPQGIAFRLTYRLNKTDNN